jgi:splicing factor 3B subunit 3
LAGVGNRLRLYEIGRKKLLRKAEIKNLNSPINTIKTWGERIYATEVNDSFHMYKYKAREQTFYDIADDILTRYITATAILDYHTMIGADKF